MSAVKKLDGSIPFKWVTNSKSQLGMHLQSYVCSHFYFYSVYALHSGFAIGKKKLSPLSIWSDNAELPPSGSQCPTTQALF